MQTIIKPIIYPITPIMTFYACNITDSTFSIALIVLSALAIIGTSVLIGWVLSKVMASKGMVSKPIFNLIASGAIGLCLFLRFGISVELIQGLFLFFVLLYRKKYRKIQKSKRINTRGVGFKTWHNQPSCIEMGIRSFDARRDATSRNRKRFEYYIG